MEDIGGILLGVAAVITALVGWRSHGKKLNEINAAVNNKAVDEPTLREAAMETHRTSMETARVIGRIEQKFDDHATSDSDRFERIDEGLVDIRTNGSAPLREMREALSELIDLRDLLRGQ